MSEKNKVFNILILGIGQSNFLNQLYGNIVSRNKKFHFSIDNYFELSRGNNESKGLPYINFYDFDKIEIKKWALKRSLFKLTKSRFFWNILFFELSQNSSFKSIKKQLYDFARAKYRVEKHILPLKNDLYHFHFCVPKNLKYIFFLPKSATVICSFWGSDLLRETGTSNVFYVRKALSKATQITIQTPELAQILLSKYGREFQSKLEILRFTISQEIYERLDKNRNNPEQLDAFRTFYDIPKDKIVIAVGHNGFKANNHIQIINQIKFLPKTILDSIVILLHLSYGAKEEYLQDLIHLSRKTHSFKIIIIKEFFDAEKISLLRLNTDILIQMPISDALSGAMTEVLYAKNIVLAGAWLPYGILRRKGVFFKEVESFNKLAFTLQECIENLNELKHFSDNNPNVIRSFLFPNTTTKEWMQLFEKTLI